MEAINDSDLEGFLDHTRLILTGEAHRGQYVDSRKVSILLNRRVKRIISNYVKIGIITCYKTLVVCILMTNAIRFCFHGFPCLKVLVRLMA